MEQLTNLSAVRALCEKHGFALKKGYGQNFLINPGIPQKICDAAGLSKQDAVLEIGPGFGTLTRELGARAGQVLALEVDTRLIPVLGETLADLPNVQVVWQDVMQVNLPALLKQHFPGQQVKVCANLPYNITSPIVMKLLEENLPLQSITAMVQKEAAQRITATPGTRAAGAISYAVHYYTKPALLFEVKPGSFYPPPKVTSAVIQLLPHTPPLAGQPAQEKRLFRLIRAAFGQRRKTLANAVCAGLALPKQQIAEALTQSGLPQNARAEQLTLNDYIVLQAALWRGETD